MSLVPQTADHAAEMFVLLSDPALYAFENAPPASEAALRERFRRLESRASADGREQWLNWVVQLPDGRLAGYVQATVLADGRAGIAYVFGSAHWGQGIATRAVAAMMTELAAHHGATRFTAVFKTANGRSRRLLERLGFGESAPVDVALDADESFMTRAS